MTFFPFSTQPLATSRNAEPACFRAFTMPSKTTEISPSAEFRAFTSVPIAPAISVENAALASIVKLPTERFRPSIALPMSLYFTSFIAFIASPVAYAPS